MRPEESRANTDDEAAAPPADILADDGRPLGDTAEAHDELSPHDLPPGHPGRQASEDQAGGEGGTTRGDADPSDT
ncbi:MAG: hypothetical protein JWO90_1274 [Solirubrobacterales bacterium]|jgi:hypothetical protein|nr:hypothetical protein [Solirubrobacterales bacterium]